MVVCRRVVLKASVLAGIAATAGGLGGLLLPRGAAAAGPGHFVVDDHTSTLFGQKTLNYRSGWQAFAYGSLADRFFYLQPANAGGITVAKQRGDLRLSTITASGSTSSSYMQLSGFGHGVTMGVQSTSSHSYIWMETDAHAETTGADATGRQICVFRWTGDNKTYKVSDLGTSKMPDSARFTLHPGSTQNSVCHEELTGRLLVRYRASDGKYYYAQHDAAAVRKGGDATPPVAGTRVIEESTVLAGVMGPYQSFTMYGDYLYVLKGRKDHNCPQQSTFDSTITSYNVAGASPAFTATTSAEASLPGREVEGLCVMVKGSSRRLCFGIKADATCGDGQNQTTGAYYKDEFAAG